VSEHFIKEEDIQELKESLRRCPEGTFEAALEYRKTGNPDFVPPIVMGIVERFLEPELRPKLKDGDDSLRLVEDLGVDSLTMMEIVILVEETVGVSFDNQELRDIRTVGEVKSYMNRKILGDSDAAEEQVLSLGYDDLISIMPMQPPFLFLQQAKVFSGEAEATYKIAGD
jgi:3-hydroxyacyl-[acyl-carrier-protein] dehydratase